MITGNPDLMPGSSVLQFVCCIVPGGYVFYVIHADMTLDDITAKIAMALGKKTVRGVYQIYHNTSPYIIVHAYAEECGIPDYKLQVINPLNIDIR